MDKYVGSGDDVEGLEGLGVSVQSQERLENEIIEQIADKLKQKEQEEVIKQVKKELRPLCERIRNTMRKKKHCERQIKGLYKSSSVLSSQQNRQISSLLNDQENLEKNLKELFAAQTSIIQRLKDCDYDYQSDDNVNRLLVSNHLDKDQEDEEGEEETELQRNIRLGDVTAFGNSLHTKSSSESNRQNFDNYLHQLGHQEGSPSSAASSCRKRRLSSDKSDSDSGFVEVRPSTSGQSRAKKRRTGKQRLLVRDSEPTEQDTDWEPPSELEEEEPLIKKKPEKKKSSKPLRKLYDKEETGWGTSDSDWEGTDDEDSPRHRRRRRVGDDGDKELYEQRVSAWQSSRSQEEVTSAGQFEELEGGLRVPAVIWSRLYNYQKVGVQWMFELHQQRCGGILGDEMGLGKTIQVITFLSALSFTRSVWPGSTWRGLGASIIVCPTTLLHQWVAEFHTWWPPLRGNQTFHSLIVVTVFVIVIVMSS